MRKIDLSNYDVEVATKDGKQKIPYDVKGSMVDGMYHPELRLGSRELFENDRVAQKINSSDEYVLLEEADYQKLKLAFDTIKGFRKEDVELVKRVLEAPEVEVKEA